MILSDIMLCFFSVKQLFRQLCDVLYCGIFIPMVCFLYLVTVSWFLTMNLLQLLNSLFCYTVVIHFYAVYCMVSISCFSAIYVLITYVCVVFLFQGFLLVTIPSCVYA